MVVFLERGASLALCENDSRVKDFVELGEVEPPTPESQALVPDSADIAGVGHAIRTDENVCVEAGPGVVVGAVGNGVAQTAGTVNLAESVNGADDGIGLAVVGKRVLQAADHGHASDGRVDGQEDVVEDDKGVEGPGLCNPPRLVAMLAVVPVDVGDGNEVDGGDGQRDLVREGALVDVLRYREWVCEGRLASPWGRNGRGRGIGGELEDCSRGPVPGVQRRACARHDDSVCGLCSYRKGSGKEPVREQWRWGLWSVRSE